MIKRNMALQVLFALLVMQLWPAHAGDVRETARAAAEKAQKSVVTVRLVIKMKQGFMGQSMDEEEKIEVTGTVIDPSGLTVTAASSVDPASILKSLMRGMKMRNVSMESEVKETTLILDDGTEVEADLVLKDTDLDMAFIKPRDAGRQFDAVALKAGNAPPQLLDNIFVLGRLGKNGNRALTLSIGAIKAIVKGPRTVYVCDNEVSGSLGCIVYAADGQPLGLFVSKQNSDASGGAGGMAMMMSMMGQGGKGDAFAIAVLRPVADIIEIAKQAKEAKPPEKKAPADEEKVSPKEEEKEEKGDQ